jgi:S-DNA-T family DNA segregation ATPase FtsK/SpoIIIE
MAQNTYKQNTVKKPNESVSREQKVAPADKFSFLKDRRLHMALGFLLMGFSMFAFGAIVSFFFTGTADESLLLTGQDIPLQEVGKEVENWLGIGGAKLAHWITNRSFGVASLLLTPLLFGIGFRLVFQRDMLPLVKLAIFSIYFTFWVSITFGLLVSATDSTENFGFLAGAFGFEMADFLRNILGWGAYLLQLFLLIIFSIYFFNISQITGSKLHANVGADLKSNEKAGTELEDNQHGSILNDVRDREHSEEDEDSTAGWVIKDLHQKGESEDSEIEPSIHTKVPAFSITGGMEEESAPTEKLDQMSSIEAEEEEETTKDMEEGNGVMVNYDPTLDLPGYQYPTLDLLNDYDTKVQVSKSELEANMENIVKTLSHYNIEIAKIEATIGPTVTLYEIIPAAGVRISKIKGLVDDIALNLAALGIRIIAPMPGKGTIGIEVPNKNREMVSMKSMLASEKFQKSDRELPIILGKTISNEVYIADLAKMPHLLIAGATGQGKSVGLNVILTSLIYKKHPSQLKFVLVDPKKVELTLFNKIERHFLAQLPGSEEAIITDTKKVVNTLNSLCIEMDERYNLLKDASVRSIKEYNTKFVERRLNPSKGHRFLPFIVLVIDELADLMMTAGKEVETPIARLAQLARAIGIHLVVATQRPSVNVITGIIKANFPVRLSFRVSSKIDSRTILDTGGAEQLVGQGDMLLSLGSDLIRIQCAFVDTPEVERICTFIGEQRGYESAYQLPEFYSEEDEGPGAFDFSERDPMFEDAARLIVLHQQGSTSLIQRKMKLGYNRAGRLMDQLEASGIVGPFEGSKAREVLIADEYSLEQLLNSLRNN